MEIEMKKEKGFSLLMAVIAAVAVICCLNGNNVLAQPPDVEIIMTPLNPPIIIPAGGGAFDFRISVINNSPFGVEFDVWIVVQLPGGSWREPFPEMPWHFEVFPGGWTIDREKTQEVRANAPAGEYIYEGRIGEYPNTIWDSDNFTFIKAGNDASSSGIESWQITADFFEDLTPISEKTVPSDFVLPLVYPNPFNPTTTLSYALPKACRVNLSIYDISGRFMATLADGYRDAGYHEVTFDATELASGVYIYILKAGTFNASGKMVLMK